jgi:hypothetical protein
MNHLLVEEDETMRLHGLRCSVAGVLKPEAMKRARDAGTFFKENGQLELALQATLVDIARSSKSEVSLKLVVP